MIQGGRGAEREDPEMQRAHGVGRPARRACAVGRVCVTCISVARLHVVPLCVDVCDSLHRMQHLSPGRPVAGHTWLVYCTTHTYTHGRS